MSKITVWRESQPQQYDRTTQDGAEIALILREIGVRFERWPTRALPPDTTPETILTAYADDIARLSRDGGYRTADVVRLARGAPNVAAMRQRFLDEHIHSEDEVRFFVEGAGAFYLRGNRCVYQVICAAGDLISVPANTRHWFDMGPDPVFTAIRLFTAPEGWVAQFTGDAIARQFPLYTAAA